MDIKTLLRENKSIKLQCLNSCFFIIVHPNTKDRNYKYQISVFCNMIDDDDNIMDTEAWSDSKHNSIEEVSHEIETNYNNYVVVDVQ